ncbi:YeeE/YedE family protein [Roseovarius salis]|uniref:YeeE/YedE family protein n=1 Tax=Roseovarius salis TaxID=3376063 RepID=UPI0037CC9B98
METHFTPIESLAGGVLIGLAAVALMAVLGRVMGATGILAGVMHPTGWRDWSWRAAVLAGMVSGPLAVLLVTGDMPRIQAPENRSLLIVGGLVVGVGVTYGSGCTSGHGVCGMARLSARSIAATGIFMVTTALTVYVIRHMIGA